MTVVTPGVLIILDGLGDRPVAALGGRTPLEAARTPVLDQLTARGLCGLIDPLQPGLPVDTHTGAGALMGVPRRALFDLARGPVEAAGVGLELEPGDVALRCNFATLARSDTGLSVIDRRAGRIDRGTEELANVLTEVPLGEAVTGTLRPATQHRAVLRLRGSGLSSAITDTDPGAVRGPARVLECRPLCAGDVAAERTARAVNAFVLAAYDLLHGHEINRSRVAGGQPPANGILTRNAGGVVSIPSLVRQLGIRAALIAGEKTMHGLGRMLGYSIVEDPRFTSLPDTDLAAKLGAMQTALDSHDLVTLHVKGTDVLSHDVDPVGKRDLVERIDAALEPLLGSDLVVAVSCDHSTDSNHGSHCGDPVPSILCAPHSRRDDCETYDERTCARGGLGRIPATALFLSVLDHMGAIPNFAPEDGEDFGAA